MFSLIVQTWRAQCCNLGRTLEEIAVAGNQNTPLRDVEGGAIGIAVGDCEGVAIGIAVAFAGNRWLHFRTLANLCF